MLARCVSVKPAKKLAKIQAECDALLTALKSFVDQTLVLPSGESVWGDELIAAQKAIAAVEGKDTK